MSNPKYAVTLIHGTFATGADWTKSGSMLRQNIAEQLKDVEFNIFNWSGRNTHQARIAAAEDLKVALKKEFAKHPDRHHYLIAHSHGGNVALYSLADSEVAEHVEGIVTMGTPFIVCRDRGVADAVKLLKFGVPALAGLLITFLFAGIAVSIGDYMINKYGTLGFLLGVGGPVVVGAMLWAGSLMPISKFVNQNGLDWAQRHQKALADRLNVRLSPAAPFLCGVISGDEARTWLKTLRGGASGFHVLFDHFGRLLRRLIWILLLGIVAGLVISIWNEGVGEIVGGVFIGVILSSLWLAGLLQLPMLIVPKLVRAHSLGFGGESLIDNWVSDINITEAPMSIECERYSSRAPVGNAGLRHSSFYEDPEFVEYAATWIAARGRGSNRKPHVPPRSRAVQKVLE